MRSRGAALAFAWGIAVTGCAPAVNRPDLLPAAQRGGVHREITTPSHAAQEYFDQGLMLTFGFDHEEAIAAFRRATEADSTCAMASWGIAYAAGPHINLPMMDEAHSKLAYESAQKALALAPRATKVEQALIEAVTKRYAWPAPADRRALDVAYADAMRAVYRTFPEDADVGALFAESLMDLRPWDLWSRDGKPRPETPEIIQVLDAVLARAPKHPGANHYAIHTHEASPTPERALGAADRLRGLVRGSGHLLHMPSHIDIRLGRYVEAIEANTIGIEADRARVQRAGPGMIYSVYRAHNFHFLAYAAMFDGQKALANRAARELVRELPMDVVRAIPDVTDGFLAAPYHAMVRFGQWQDILNEPPPAGGLPVTRAFWHYARGIAFSSLGRTEEAAAERDSLVRASARVPESAYIGNNTARVVLEIAAPMLEGELEYRRGNHERAFALLREAVARDDSLRYDEPWGWMQPVRHALGALLLEQGRVEEAERVYREDLAMHPGNGWSLHGLAECLRKSGRAAEAVQVDERFRSAWARSDIALRASCFCRIGT